MFVAILVCAALVVCSSVQAITLPNGFTFDETQLLNMESRATNYALQKCNYTNSDCSNDCSTQLLCDDNKNVFNVNPCPSNTPYCVPHSSYYLRCSSNFPVSNQACAKSSINNFMCTEDGQFPDPTDCNKYHICNGDSHTVAECPAHSTFTHDRLVMDPYTNPGNGEFSCRFGVDHDSCMCNSFYCDNDPNSFTFRAMDYLHYGYCLNIGTVKKIMMFKCPKGTRHFGLLSQTNSVDCVPIV